MTGKIFTARTSLLALTMALLGACAGGGGGGGGGGGMPSPPSPPAPPPPPPPPLAAVLLGPFAAAAYDGSAHTAGQETSGVNLRVVDPDAPNATEFSQLNFDGDETITVNIASNGVIFGQTFSPSSMIGVFNRSFLDSNSIDSRDIDNRLWQQSNGSLQFYRLQEGDYDTYAPSGDLADHVALLRWGDADQPWFSGNRSGFQLFGSPASSIPVTGSALFRGEAIGVFAPTVGQRTDFAARTGIEIDFSRSSGAIRGGLEDFRGTLFVDVSQLDFNFIADIQGTTFASTSVDFPLLGGTPSGSVLGQFYGPANGLELGGAFDVEAPGAGRLFGGFTTGQVANETRQFAFSGGASSQTVTYGVMQRDSGGSSAAAPTLASGAGNSISFNPNGFVDTDDAFDPQARVPNGGGVVVFGSPGFDASDLEPSLSVSFSHPVRPPGATNNVSLFPDVWTDGGSTLARYPLAVMANGQWRLPLFTQVLEYSTTLPSGPFPITEYDLFTTLGPRTSLAQMPGAGRASYVGEAFGTYQDMPSDTFSRLLAEIRLTADFGAGSLEGVMLNFFAQDLNGAGISSGIDPNSLPREISFSGALGTSFITTNPVAHTSANPQGTALTGSVYGEFYGVDDFAASELGGSFAFEQAGTFAYAGAFVTGRNPIVGLTTPITQNFSSAPGASNFLFSGQPLDNLAFSWTRGGPAIADDTATLSFERSGTPTNIAVPGVGEGNSRGVVIAPSGFPGPAHETANIGSTSPIRIGIVEEISGRSLNYASIGYNFPGTGDHAYFAFGRRTASMPTTGSARYNGLVRGEYDTPGTVYAVAGDFALDANFASGALSGATDVRAFDMFGGSPAGVDLDFSFNGTIANSGFSSSFTTADSALTGTITGIFAGPNAEEVAGGFATAPSGSGARYEGAFVGQR